MSTLKIQGRMNFTMELNPEKTDVLISIDLNLDNKKHHPDDVNMEELKFRTATTLGAFLLLDQVKAESTRKRRKGDFDEAKKIEEVGKPIAQHFMKYLQNLRNYMLTRKL